MTASGTSGYAALATHSLTYPCFRWSLRLALPAIIGASRAAQNGHQTPKWLGTESVAKKHLPSAHQAICCELSSTEPVRFRGMRL